MKQPTLKTPKSRDHEWRYQPVEGHWDEALWRANFPRRHWRKLMVSLGRLGFRQLSRRWQAGQQLIQANGVTYNVYGDPQGKERPWLMDPIPLVISGQEWTHIERSIVQRASVLNSMLGDLYGSKSLITSRLLPAAMLFANRNFLRACAGIVPPGGVYLHSYAADLARSPDGNWWVIADRTQAPSGIGYALENRLVSARTLPSVFSQCDVRQLTRFFEAQRDGLLAMAPNHRGNPRIVLLTPGPHNETYFEHSFLARHWGFPLVEGADLTVRDNRVFLKTLAGLEPVDLILRRMDDSFCDPMELRGDSVLGIPGLVQAVRSGNVAVANALGSGLLETASYMAFLPPLCRHLLGEELQMPSVATWWCGDAAPRQYVLEHLEQLVIKPAFPRFGQKVEFPAAMDTAGREDLARRIAAQPEQFVAQEQVALSTAPVRTDSGLAARHVVLRVFAAWDGSSYTVMPGGLTRVSTADRSLVVSMQLGGGSKDTWVLGASHEEPSFHRALSPHAPAVHLTESSSEARRSSGELPSRVADNLFWLGRYAERVEAAVRLVRALLPGLSGEEDFGRTASIETVVHLLSGLGYLQEESTRSSLAQQRWQAESVLTSMVFDPSRSSTIGWSLKHIRRVTWPLKERLSQDTWRVLQQLETDFSSTPPVSSEQRLVAAMSLLDHAIVTLSAFAGLLMESTTRGYGWRFLDIGRRLERALQTADWLRVGIAQAPFENEPYLELLLQIADSSITYRTRYLTAMRTENVLELLLADEANPRSIAFQVVTLLDHVENLPWRKSGETRPIEYEMASRIPGAIRRVNMEDLATRDAEGNLGPLEDLMKELKTDLYDVSDALTARYLSHLTPSKLTTSF
jgi:uncharacterized circularly permuted ATP-grasp superfamily protein/uncharacterized alpha-E superfamily protein